MPPPSRNPAAVAAVAAPKAEARAAAASVAAAMVVAASAARPNPQAANNAAVVRVAANQPQVRPPDLSFGALQSVCEIKEPGQIDRVFFMPQIYAAFVYKRVGALLIHVYQMIADNTEPSCRNMVSPVKAVEFNG